MEKLEVTKLHGHSPDALAEEIAKVRDKANEIIDALDALTSGPVAVESKPETPEAAIVKESLAPATPEAEKIEAPDGEAVLETE
jgi:hypothetical protein